MLFFEREFALTVFQPISPRRAFSILQALPSSCTYDEAIKLIAERFNVSINTAKVYLRALRAWGLISGKKELLIKKVSFAAFVDILRKKILHELPVAFFYP